MLDNAEIITEAREMRANEIQRIRGLLWSRLRLVAGLATESLAVGIAALAEFIRPAFSWNPQERRHS
jgi:hypothetical protein